MSHYHKHLYIKYLDKNRANRFWSHQHITHNIVSRLEGCAFLLTCSILSCLMLRIQICSLTLATVSYFWIISEHKLKLIAMSQCHRHHRLAIEDYVWEAVVRGLQGPDVCLFSLALVQAGSGRTDRQGEFPGKRRKKKKKRIYVPENASCFIRSHGVARY